MFNTCLNLSTTHTFCPSAACRVLFLYLFDIAIVAIWRDIYASKNRYIFTCFGVMFDAAIKCIAWRVNSVSTAQRWNKTTSGDITATRLTDIVPVSVQVEMNTDQSNFILYENLSPLHWFIYKP